METSHVKNPEPTAATIDLPKVAFPTRAIFAPIHKKKEAKNIAIRAAIKKPPMVSSNPVIIVFSILFSFLFIEMIQRVCRLCNFFHAI
jgi:hypothetical protein